jgi:hypothetical protein
MTNHPNRGWRRRWTVHHDSLVAVHETGVTVRVLDDTTRPTIQFKLENVEAVKGTKWESDVGRLVTEAIKLFSEKKKT